MRRIPLIFLCLSLPGCGYNTWAEPPFSTGRNPNMPVGSSENMLRVMGERVEAKALTPEPGDVWPGPIQPPPTLQDIEKQGQQSQPQRPVPGSPDYQGQLPDRPSPSTRRGSSTPPGSSQQGLAPLPTPSPPQSTNPSPPPRNPAGQVYQTPSGPTVTDGGTRGYQTTTTPGGGSAIIVPNGNGTSTIIHSDGRIETVATPR
jgi:hypothetical protein